TGVQGVAPVLLGIAQAADCAGFVHLHQAGKMRGQPLGFEDAVVFGLEVSRARGPALERRLNDLRMKHGLSPGPAVARAEGCGRERADTSGSSPAGRRGGGGRAARDSSRHAASSPSSSFTKKGASSSRLISMISSSKLLSRRPLPRSGSLICWACAVG